jgi:hypothetical protein
MPRKKRSKQVKAPEAETGEEKRLFQVNVRGKNVLGQNVIHGTEMKSLTKKEALKEGFPWTD